jgi:hypothetical protein
MESPNQGFLPPPHRLSLFPTLVVISEEMQDPVDHQAVQLFLYGVAVLGGLGDGTIIGDHDIAEVRRHRWWRYEPV